jgi:hypothetical protein
VAEAEATGLKRARFNPLDVPIYPLPNLRYGDTLVSAL